jgi:membrane protein DedA with SNARE-associated domain
MDYLLIFAVIFAINLLPAFAPPTWTALVYFSLSSDLPVVAIVALGVVAATCGRWILAHSSRYISKYFSDSYRANLDALGRKINQNKGSSLAALMLFFFSPLSSAQLFIAAGLMQSVKLPRLLIAFAIGRTISYTTYVAGAEKFAETDLGAEITSNLTSPWFIVLQLVLLGLVIALGRVDWDKKLSSK